MQKGAETGRQAERDTERGWSVLWRERIRNRLGR